MSANVIEADGLGGYRKSEQVHSFSYDTGVVVCPVGSRESAHRQIRLHGGYGMRTNKWHLKRAGKPPIIPVMADTSEDSFLGGTVAPTLPQPSRVTPDTYDWDVSGEYTYVQNAPRIAGTHAFPVGQHPFFVAGAADAASAALEDVVPSYTGSTPFQTVAALLAGTVTINPDGDYAWPYLALPALFSSDHIFQD